MKYTVEFEVEVGNCKLYEQFNKNDVDGACKICPLNDAYYCMDLNMHKAKVINVNLQ